MLKTTQAREQDRGLYSCLASNEAGEARRNFSVEVLGRAHLYVLRSTRSPLLPLGRFQGGERLGRALIPLFPLCSGDWGGTVPTVQV